MLAFSHAADAADGGLNRELAGVNYLGGAKVIVANKMTGDWRPGQHRHLRVQAYCEPRRALVAKNGQQRSWAGRSTSTGLAEVLAQRGTGQAHAWAL